MRKLLLFLLPFFLFAREENPYEMAVFGGEPNSIVAGCVSAITGEFFTNTEDLVVRGHEPIRIQRRYYSRNDRGHFAGWNYSFNYLCASLIIGAWLEIPEKSGIRVTYCIDPTTSQYKPVKNIGGLSNCPTGELSARLNVYNNRASLSKNKKQITVQGADGSIRRYETDIDVSRLPPLYPGLVPYRLVSEVLPNGNKTYYQWVNLHGVYEVKEVRTISPKGKLFAKVGFSYDKPDKDHLYSVTVNSSDHRKICYRFNPHFKHKKKRYHILKNVTFSDRPREEYDFWGAEKGGVLLSWKQLPDARNLNIHHYCLGRNNGFNINIREDNFRYKKVKILMRPVGEDSKLVPSHRFFYRPGKYKEKGGHTSVYDAYNNLTRYHYDKNFRLTRVERCIGKTELFSQELYEWDAKGWLHAKTLLGRDHQPLLRHVYHYDQKGNVVQTDQVGDFTGSGNEETFSVARTFYPNLLLKTEEYPNGRMVEYHYEGNTDLLTAQLTYHEGILKERIFYAYDDTILIEKVHDDGNAKEKDNLSGVTQRLITQITPREESPFIGFPKVVKESYYEPRTGEVYLLSKKELQYNKHGQVILVNHYDSNGDFAYALIYTYDGRGRLATQTDPLGRERKIDYDANDNPIIDNDPNENFFTQTAFDYSNRPYKAAHINPSATQAVTCQYNHLSQKISTIDNQGNTTHITYDPFGHPTQTQLPAVQGKHPLIKNTYNALGKPITQTDPRGHTTHTTHTAYTAQGKPYHIIHPNGDEEHYIYTLEGHLKKHTSPGGTETHYTHDAQGRITFKTIKKNGKDHSTESYTYNTFHLIKYTAPDGVATHYTYNGAGQKIQEQTLDRITTYTYDPLGRLEKTIRGPQVHITKYDLLDRPTLEEERDLEGTLYSYTHYTYDGFSNKETLTKEVHVGKAVETYHYDPFRRQTLHIDPLGHETRTTYDDHYVDTHGQTVIKKTTRDPLGHLTIEIYDPLGRLATLQKISKDTTLLLTETFTYDLSGNKIAQTSHFSGKTITKTWEYNSLNQLIALHEPQGKTTTYTYTPDGHLKTLTKPDGVTITYTYNALGQQTSIKAPHIHYTLTHDALGNIITSTDHIHNQTTTRTHNHFSQLLTETLANGLSTRRTYDTLGRKTHLYLPRATVHYHYDPYHLIQITRLTPQGEPLYTHTYDAYDLSHNILQENETTHYTYDLLSRSVHIETPTITQSIPHIDPNGNIYTYIRNDEVTAYDYDPLNQLIYENDTSYTYDAHHNRTSKNERSIPLNDLNQIATHHYDLNGNTLSDHSARYRYDALDRLIRIEKGSQALALTYDSWGRCHTHTTSLYQYQQWVPQTPKPLLYDDQCELGIYPHQLRILGQGQGAEIGATIALELNQNIYFPTHDFFGNIISIEPQDAPSLWGTFFGPQKESYHFTAFGEERSHSDLNPWRYQSKRHIFHLVQFGRRLYDPQTGRWLSPDPKGFSEGPNLYQFLLNNPHLTFDLYGEAVMPPHFRAYHSGTLNHIASGANAILQNPRFQGACQAFGGLTEMTIGGTLAVGSGGLAAPAGFFVIAHGLDYFITGVRAVISGEFEDTVTTQLLQKTSLSHNMATNIDNGISLIGSMGSMALIRRASQLSFPAFKLPDKTLTSSLSKELPHRKIGRRNRFVPNPKAKGPHTVFRTDLSSRRVTHYETFHPQTNPYDPKPWESLKRYDGIGKSHRNKILKMDINTPHIHDPQYPGGIRYPKDWELTR
ncbi:RHS repeat-associated core domain-containing protein [Candidatus Neptunochlamydia vexilliferae]|uniref:Rhs family protein n=1 Tax=Candidatus Neptunichlamydia vexilliferae TaxID=1651774 RepID=A0ABS0AYC3_9BACT|nr:RHS repeat-associated core domain-containing protein [Candidatus Neptunochlamydia vexilliferae]MBF5058597.1 hypothetical protein [Candidatus Neptunochlamydia vexilliferae]